MAKIRKLLNLETLDKAVKLFDLGVPIAKVHKVLGLDKVWSYQTTVNLIHADIAGYHKATRPPWLVEGGDVIQTPPNNWTFSGAFPQGCWVRKGELVNG